MRSWLSVLIADAMSKKRDDIPIAPSLYSLSNKMDNSLLAVRDINHKYIVVERGRKMLIVRGIMWISVLIVMLICMVKTKRNGMKKKIRALIFVVFLFILFVFMPYSTEAPIENLFITFKTPEQAIHYINAPFSNDKIEDIIVGQDTCMAVFESGQDEELYAGRDMWLRKGEKGYKLISAAGVQKAILSNDIRDEDLDIFISKLDYLSDYQKRQIAFAVKRVIIQHSHGGRQFLETSYEDIISHIKRYCLAKSKKTGDYFCLRGDNLEDVEAVNKVCEELMKRYANK